MELESPVREPRGLNDFRRMSIRQFSLRFLFFVTAGGGIIGWGFAEPSEMRWVVATMMLGFVGAVWGRATARGPISCGACFGLIAVPLFAVCHLIALRTGLQQPPIPPREPIDSFPAIVFMGLPWGGLLGMIAAFPVEIASRCRDNRTRRLTDESDPEADAARVTLNPLLNTRQSHASDAEEALSGRPTFDWQERHLLDYLEYRSQETDWFSVIYFTSAALCLLWGLYVDEPIFILMGAFVVATGRFYENKMQATGQPVLKSIFAKYESALDAALQREETPRTVDQPLDDHQVPMDVANCPLPIDAKSPTEKMSG